MPSLAEAEQRLAQAQCHHGILRDPYGPACEQITAGKHCELQHEALVGRLTAVHRCEAGSSLRNGYPREGLRAGVVAQNAK